MYIATSRSDLAVLNLVLRAGVSACSVFTLGGYLGFDTASLFEPLMFALVVLVSLFTTMPSSRLSAANSSLFSSIFSSLSAWVKSFIVFIAMLAGEMIGCVMY